MLSFLRDCREQIVQDVRAVNIFFPEECLSKNLAAITVAVETPQSRETGA